MIRVNLIRKEGPEEVTFTSRTFLMDLILKIILLISFTIVLTYWENYRIGLLKEKRNQLKLEMEQTSTQVKEKKKNISHADEISKEIDESEKKKSVLISLAKRRTQLLKVLDHLQNVTPERLWLSSIQYQPKNAKELKMKGRSFSNENISLFIRDLESGGLLENINLERSFYNRSQNINILEFELTCQLRKVS